jgi:hypothetical protein
MGGKGMRDILFRGKRKDNGGWVHGYYRVNHVRRIHTIELSLNCNEVIPESVGQFTGLLDIHGKKIFEGDIAKVYIEGCLQTYPIKIKMPDIFIDPYYQVDLDNIEVIGNVTDNKELLEVKE